MQLPALLRETLRSDRIPRLATDGIWTVLPEGTPEQPYDRRAAAYDRVVGSRPYNRILWGSSPADYQAFAQQAVYSARSGPFLDAGCGSLIFTASHYAATERPIVLLDKSLGMLRQARTRLFAQTRTLPGHIVLLQADLLDLPFRPSSFSTVLSMGMLHLFEDRQRLLRELFELLSYDGELFLTSLVSERRVGRRYLSLLHRAGEVATPRTAQQLQAELSQALADTAGKIRTAERSGSMAYFTIGRSATRRLRTAAE